jgi:hypothetical protein
MLYLIHLAAFTTVCGLEESEWCNAMQGGHGTVCSHKSDHIAALGAAMSKSDVYLRLRADHIHNQLFDLHSELRAVERRIRVLGCRSFGGMSRVVRAVGQMSSCSHCVC